MTGSGAMLFFDASGTSSHVVLMLILSGRNQFYQCDW
jgi:hypothetical protein